MAKSDQFVKDLEEFAYQYIDECVNNTREHATGSGKVVQVRDRYIPTIAYFLRYWLPKHNDMNTITRKTWYQWLNDNESKSDTIKRIDNAFNSVGTDIVANEGRGIFYAKNKLGMHDKQHIESKNVDKFDFDS